MAEGTRQACRPHSALLRLQEQEQRLHLPERARGLGERRVADAVHGLQQGPGREEVRDPLPARVRGQGLGAAGAGRPSLRLRRRQDDGEGEKMRIQDPLLLLYFQDVRNIIVEICTGNGNMDEKEAENYVKKLESQKRYSADVWS